MANTIPPAPMPKPPASGPFVLLDDAGAQGTGEARLYHSPSEIVVARRADDVAAALERIDALSRAGHALAGYVAYEAGLALEPRLAPLAARRCGADGPLVWFGAFAGWHSLPATDVPGWLAAHSSASTHSTIGPMVPQLSPGAYASAFATLQRAITDGDIYQANFTFPLGGGWRGDPLAIYAALRRAGGASHGGLVYDGSHWLLSLSPELFFATNGDDVTVKPMKGTRPRGRDAAQDAALIADLAHSPKDRAENLMILDLMRNDLSRVAVPGSVQVSAPFAVETFPSVHQMTSTIHARLPGGMGAVALLRALFPCGSVTGAPKIRAMELIDQTELAPRGAYCGAIGRIDPIRPDLPNGTGDAAFNVAIRTLRLTPGEGGLGKATMGVGSAITADSVCLAEWRECLVKGGFVHQPSPQGAAPQGQEAAAVAQFDLIETMRFAPDEGVPLLEFHLERIKTSAAALGFGFDRHAVRNAIQALCFEAETPSRLRLLLGRSGATSLEISDLPQGLDEPALCAVLPLPVDSGDWRLRHKTSDRWFYEAGLQAGRAAGGAECLFIRDDGLVTEGCFTNIFVERGGQLLTPPASLGLLPGVLRQSLLASGRATEAELTLDDLAGGFFIGNALRGLISAELLA